MKQCISMICTCGRHRCPKLAKTAGTQAHIPLPYSEYKNEFVRKAGPVTLSCKPAQQYRPSSTPLDDNTMYRSAYIPHKLESKFVRQQPRFHAPTTPMDAESTYKHDYEKKMADRIRSYMPQYRYQPPTETFPSDTTHRVDYRPVGQDVLNACRNPPIRHGDSMSAPSLPFEGTTEFKDRYRQYPFYERLPAFLPPRGGPRFFTGAGDPPDLSTTYANDYVPRPFVRTPAFKPKSKYHSPQVQFNEHSTYSNDYRSIPYHERVHSFKPPHAYRPYSAPMDGTTTTQDAYLPWPAAPPCKPPWARRMQYASPTQPLDANTMYRDSYRIPPRMQRTTAFRPEAGLQSLGENEPFDENTEYKERYRLWPEIEPRKTMAPRWVYQPPHHKFDGETIFKRDYKGLYAPPVKPIRPSHDSQFQKFNNQIPMEDDTTYRNTYIKHSVQTCPAAPLKGGPDPTGRYQYVNQDSRGHHFYVKVNDQIDHQDDEGSREL